MHRHGKGDLHDIGKNLVKMMMEGKGLEVVDLGTDVDPETYVKTAVEQNCQIICCSALLTTTMPVMGEVVKEAEKAGIRGKVKIMIGGAPVTEASASRSAPINIRQMRQAQRRSSGILPRDRIRWAQRRRFRSSGGQPLTRNA